MSGPGKGINIAQLQSSLMHNDEVSGEQPAPTAIAAVGEGVFHDVVAFTKVNLPKHVTISLLESHKSLGANFQLGVTFASQTDKNWFGLPAVGSLPSESGDDADSGAEEYGGEGGDDGHNAVGDMNEDGYNNHDYHDYDNPYPYSNELIDHGDGMSFAGNGDHSQHAAPISSHGIDDEYNGRGL